jgi:hypothetical protein
MIKIIGIGKAGNKVLDFLKTQAFHFLDEEEIEFFSIRNYEDYKLLKYDENVTFYTIAGLGGETGTKYIRLITKEAKNLQIKHKNILLLPFSYEGKGMGVNGLLKKLVLANQNIELFANDDLVTEASRNLDESELLRLYDKKIFEVINTKKHIENSSFIIDKVVNNKKYISIMIFSLKHYKQFLISPKFKMIDYKFIGEEMPTSFGIVDEKYGITDCDDIKKIAVNILDTYLSKTT